MREKSLKKQSGTKLMELQHLQKIFAELMIVQELLNQTMERVLKHSSEVEKLLRHYNALTQEAPLPNATIGNTRGRKGKETEEITGRNWSSMSHIRPATLPLEKPFKWSDIDWDNVTYRRYGKLTTKEENMDAKIKNAEKKIDKVEKKEFKSLLKEDHKIDKRLETAEKKLKSKKK